jgi:MFS family permease
MATVAAIGPGWPVAAIVAVSAVSGLAVTSWNGVYLAEVATLAPPDRVGEATSGSTFCTFIGYVVSPTLFAAIVTATGSYPGAFLLTAALPLTAALALVKRHAGASSP